MKKIAILLTVLVTIAFVGAAFAVPAGKTVDFGGGPMGKVVFDGKMHADKGLKCNDCHTKLFQMKKGTAQIKQADHNSDKFCFGCHNGTKAPKTCTNCHKKKAGGY